MNSVELKQVSRADLPALLRLWMPWLEDGAVPSETRGGRAAALDTLSRIDPPTYERSRNFLSGAVTRLSPYLRHGVVTLAEVRDAALQAVPEEREAAKLVNELGWRDYWQRLYAQIGDGVWQDREGWKTGLDAEAYAQELPEDIAEGRTTLRCMDSFAQDLRTTGYMHNHARMWTAAYVVHWRRVRWQAGARWFLRHLLDGDPASNNLSWQWIASTFGSKPYVFNRENLERYTDGVYCRACPHAAAGTCPFDRDYEALEQQLFPRWEEREPAAAVKPAVAYAEANAGGQAEHLPVGSRPLLWHHTDGLNPADATVRQHAGASAVFVWDTAWVREENITLKVLAFLAECVAEMPGTVEVRAGDVAAEVLAAARAAGADAVLAQRTPDPRLLRAAAAIRRELPVVWFDPPPFVESSRGFDLKRFSRYWKRAAPAAMLPTRMR